VFLQETVKQSGYTEALHYEFKPFNIKVSLVEPGFIKTNLAHSGQLSADEIGKLLNQNIEYVPIPVDIWIDAMKNLPTVNEFLANHLREFSKDIALGKFNKTTDVVKTITGHEPRSFEGYIKEHIDVFVN